MYVDYVVFMHNTEGPFRQFGIFDIGVPGNSSIDRNRVQFFGNMEMMFLDLLLIFSNDFEGLYEFFVTDRHSIFIYGFNLDGRKIFGISVISYFRIWDK